MKIKKNRALVFGLFISIFFVNFVVCSSVFETFNLPLKRDTPISELTHSRSINLNPKLAQISGNFSNYKLTVRMDESRSRVEGNLTVDFYNNDNVNFTKIPFHLYLSGMAYYQRQGDIEIINVTDLGNPSIYLPFEIFPLSQLMWVNLTQVLEPQNRAQFEIQFNATLPDGTKLMDYKLDRANSYGYDGDQSRIYKFASFYPIPCVFDNEDGWNTDPYLNAGDPFYFDMAFYNFFIEAPKGMVIAATGNLEEKLDKGATSWYHFNPIYPVREVTFSASRYFQVESKIFNGVNISSYFLLKDYEVWHVYAINIAQNALNLFNNTFGPYLYSTLNVVEEYAFHLGMEYPNQVYISETIGNQGNPLYIAYWLLEKVIAHEVAHQWWYNLIGNDEVDLGFLDEGLTCWSTDYYGEHYYGDWEYFQYTKYIDLARSYYVDTGLSSKINQSVYNHLSLGTDWIYVNYYKSPLILEKLRQTIGHSNFINGLKSYYENHKFDHAILSDLQESFEDILGESLDWFFFPWFDNLYFPKYSFDSYSFNPDTLELQFSIIDINVHMEGEQPPLNQYSYSQDVPLRIYGEDNQILTSQTITIATEYTASIILSEIPSKVALIYDNFILVQLDHPSQTRLEQEITLQPEIPGYEFGTLLLISTIAIGIIVFLERRKEIYER